MSRNAIFKGVITLSPAMDDEGQEFGCLLSLDGVTLNQLALSTLLAALTDAYISACPQEDKRESVRLDVVLDFQRILSQLTERNLSRVEEQ